MRRMCVTVVTANIPCGTSSASVRFNHVSRSHDAFEPCHGKK